MFDVWSYLVIHLALGNPSWFFSCLLLGNLFSMVGCAAVIGLTLEDLSPKCAVPDCIFFGVDVVVT